MSRLIKYKLQLNVNDTVLNIEYERPSVSLDGRTFSCVVSQDYGITSDDVLIVEYSGQSLTLKPKVNNFIEQGWTTIPTAFRVFEKNTLTNSEAAETSEPQLNCYNEQFNIVPTTDTTTYYYIIDNDNFI